MLYVYSVPSGAVTVIEPAAGSAQVGSVEVVATVGAPAGALISTLPVVWQAPATLVHCGEDWKLVPSIEYVYSAPKGAVTVIEPAAGSAQVGSVELVVTVGAVAGALMVTLPVAVQLSATLLT